jgi:hypothetical protein
MQCLGCQTDNSPQAKFCLGCGARLVIVCPAGAAEFPGGARFCNQRGTPSRRPLGLRLLSRTPRHLADRILTSRSAFEGERKQTVLRARLNANPT